MITNAERWQQIEVIYYAALEIPAAARADFLQQACAGDTQLRSEVDSLLSSHDQASGFLDSPALEVAAREVAESASTTVINATLPHYRIISALGQGGMGRVYLAEDTRLRRRVALKLLDVTLVANPQLRARFVREAQLASALDHPNICTVHEIGDAAGQPFIAMQFVEGQSLKQVIAGRPLALDSLLSLALQVADALAAAHEQGIIHRDIKSSNIIITPRGQAKVLDFGLAKLVAEVGDAASELTQTGAVMGTPAYMSPEQARGERVDHRSDLFSFGVVLYEMATGRVPFKEKSQPETLNAIINQPHLPVRELNREIPPLLAAVIDRALAKRPEDRCSSMRQMIADLRQFAAQAGRLQSQGSDVPDGVVFPYVPPRRPTFLARLKHGVRAASLNLRLMSRLWLVVVVIAAVALALWGYIHYRNRQWAAAQVPRVEELAQAGRFFEAYDLAVQVRRYLSDEPTITRLMPTIGNTLSVNSEPAGAQVYLKRFSPDGSTTRQPVGTTPIRDLQIARGDYLLTIEKPGFASLERTISGALWDEGTGVIIPPPLRIEARLIEAGRVPDRMAYVPGSDYRIVAWRRPTDARVRLGDFFIDRFEVSNQEFKEFVNAGGYQKREYWKYPFVKDGKPLAWEAAIRELHDRTGLPGPREWANQTFAEGQAQHPVTGVTFYEAAAYAEFRGKRLPTLFQWEKAARDGVSNFVGLTMPWGLMEKGVDQRANFKREGTAPVNSFEFGMSPFGCYNMAGNVSEWCLNETSQGFFIAGGSWEDPTYLFGYYGTYPAFYSSNKIGFRCAMSATDSAEDQSAMRMDIAAEVPRYTPAADATVKEWMKLYAYERTPLDAQVVEVTEAETWQREKITFKGAGGERALAYLYLPKNFRRPLQVIHLLPAADVTSRARSLTDSMEINFASLVGAGRALFAVVQKGFIGRDRPASAAAQNDPAEYRDRVLTDLIELRRGLDYLETRQDIDASRIAMFGPSGGVLKLILPAIETRYRSVAYNGTGIRRDYLQLLPEINPINYVGHIRAPKLLVQGRYDEADPLTTQGEPLFQLLAEPKRRILFDGGHIPPPQMMFPALNNWLDETMGAVIRN
ncbi:MAG: protein kinase domain-containing protein [Blastocatellia bacterium]